MDERNVAEGVVQIQEEIARLLAASVTTASSRIQFPSLEPAAANSEARQPTVTSANAPGLNQVSGAGQSALTLATSLLSPALKTFSPQTGAGSWLRWLNPIASLFSLFGGGEEESPASPAKLSSAATGPVTHRAGIQASSGWRVQETDYSSEGRARVTAPAPAPSVVVQVQAIDSRSFLDHSDAIADAVKKSLMESHGLADAFREL